MKKNKIIKQYTDRFKDKVLYELEYGRFASLTEAQQHYNIGGSSTITRWLHKAGKSDILPKIVVIDVKPE